MSKIKEKILSWYKHTKMKRFWENPDEAIVALILDDKGEQVLGMLKDEFALIDRIPNPHTGFSFLDIVKVSGPIGKQRIKDDIINAYRVLDVQKKSNIQTFTFRVIIRTANEYFKLLDCFTKFGQKAELPWTPKENNNEWIKGYCTSDNLEQARMIVNEFVKLNSSIQIKDVYNWDYYQEKYGKF